MELVLDMGHPVTVNNSDLIMAQFPTNRQEPECMFLLGTYLELVDREVVSKQKELLVDTLLGVLKSKVVRTRSRAVPRVQIVL